MVDSTKITAGDLRKALRSAKATWEARKDLKDKDEVPTYPTGAGTGGRRLASNVPRISFKKALGASANPFVMERRLQRGVVNKQVLKMLAEELEIKAAAKEAPSGGAALKSVDWRNRWGWPWITTVRDQNGCEACWAFAATALVEAMTRIEHAVWTHRSEGDVHKGMKAVCKTRWSSVAALTWMKDHGGLADPACFPWTTKDIAYKPTPDRKGRTVRIPAYKNIGSVNDQKLWLDTVGPLVAWFNVWKDFFGYGSGIYKKQAHTGTPPNQVPNEIVGGHLMLIVGYDDKQSCWIVKNSWGTGWGDSGYCRVAYGECGIDNYAKQGLQGTNPDPWTKRLFHNGNIIESGKGKLHRNFEMLSRSSAKKLQHWWRDNSKSGFPWAKAYAPFGNDVSSFPTLTATTFNRNFECVYTTTQNRLHHWWFSQNTKKWKDGGVFGPTDAVGVAGFIQSNYNAPGNFEVVVRTKDGKLNHWWRIGEGPWTWKDGGRFAGNVSLSGAALLQSRFGKRGNFELVCVLTSGKMEHWCRVNDNGSFWKKGPTFGSSVKSPPCMIEALFGAEDETDSGNFELCVAVGGKVQHWWRNNSGSLAWAHSATFGHHVKQVVGLVQGSYPFNLEVLVLRSDNKLQHYWRTGMKWHEGAIIGSI